MWYCIIVLLLKLFQCGLRPLGPTAWINGYQMWPPLSSMWINNKEAKCKKSLKRAKGSQQIFCGLCFSLFVKDPLARNLHSDPKGYSLSIWLPLISFILRVIHLKHHLLQEKETKGEKTVLLMLTHNTKKDNLQKKCSKA